MKKLMLLGGSRYLLPVIEAARKMGIYTITCDYLPDNIAHKYSDEYCNVSVMDKDMVLQEAQKKKIDGIMSFACDPGVVTAAYVAEKMKLPFQCSYDSAMILQDKGMFRQFLLDHHFNSPHARRYDNKEQPYEDIDYFDWPVIVKPTDSAGSKGVSRVDTAEKLETAIENAISESHNGKFIIEDFLTFEGYHSSADVFTINGKLKFVSFSDQLFDKEADNPYTPAYIIWPSSMKQKYQDELASEIQRCMTLLGVKNGIYNIETCVANGKPYIMEISPRGGGCKIAELQKMAYGIDFIENEIRQAVGLPIAEMKQTECNGHWCEMVVHAKPGRSGVLKDISFETEIEKKYIQLKDISASTGDYVKPFTGANMALGDIFLKFTSREELNEVISKSSEWVNINLE